MTSAIPVASTKKIQNRTFFLIKSGTLSSCFSKPLLRVILDGYVHPIQCYFNLKYFARGVSSTEATGKCRHHRKSPSLASKP